MKGGSGVRRAMGFRWSFGVAILIVLVAGSLNLYQKARRAVAESREVPEAGPVVPPPAVLEAAAREDLGKARVGEASRAGRLTSATTLEELRSEAMALFPDREQRAAYLATALVFLGVKNPMEVIRFFRESPFPDHPLVVEGFLTAWDEEVFAPEIGDRPRLLDVFVGLMGERPGEAVGVLPHLPESDLKNVLAFELAQAWWESDAGPALAWFGSLPASPSKEMAASAIGGRWAERDAEAAANWSLELSESDRLSALGAVLSYWVGKRPSEAMGWVQGNLSPDDRIYSGLAPLVADSWARTGSGDVFGWIATLPAREDREEALLAAVLGSVEANPVQAVSRIEELSVSDSPESGMAAELVMHAFSGWANRDPVGAATHLGTLSAPALRDRAIFGFASTHAEEDPASALEWSLSISDEPLRRESVGQVVEMWMVESGRAAALRDLEGFAGDLRNEGRKEEAALVDSMTRSILTPSD